MHPPFRIAFVLLSVFLILLCEARSQDEANAYPVVQPALKDLAIPRGARIRLRDYAGSNALGWIETRYFSPEDQVSAPDSLVSSGYKAMVRCFLLAPFDVQQRMLRWGPIVYGDTVIALYLEQRLTPWAVAWWHGERTTNDSVNRWSSRFDVTVESYKDWSDGWGVVKLRTGRPVSKQAVQKLFASIPGVSAADPLGVEGIGVGFGMDDYDPDAYYNEPPFRLEDSAWVFAYATPCPDDQTAGCGPVYRVGTDGVVNVIPPRQTKP